MGSNVSKEAAAATNGAALCAEMSRADGHRKKRDKAYRRYIHKEAKLRESARRPGLPHSALATTRTFHTKRAACNGRMKTWYGQSSPGRLARLA